MRVLGENFTPSCVVHLDGVAQQSTVHFRVRVQFTVQPSLETAPRAVTITVVDQSP